MYRREADSPSRRARRGWPMMVLAAFLAFAAPMLCCAGDSPQGAAAANMLQTEPTHGDYVIGPEDKLRIRVFEVQELSSDEEQVDANGQIQLPLIGRLTAAGKTAGQLEDEIARRLGDKYLQSPQVSVAVEESASQKVTVEGDVKNAGVFQMRGNTTLMQAIAMAGGMGETANYHKVAVIRTINGAPRAQVCDFALIKDGRSPDPMLQGNDVVVVDGSAAKTAWSQIVKTLPLFAFLAYFN